MVGIFQKDIKLFRKTKSKNLTHMMHRNALMVIDIGTLITCKLMYSYHAFFVFISLNFDHKCMLSELKMIKMIILMSKRYS